MKTEDRRNLPHLQPEGRTFFVTFSTWKRWILPESVRPLVLRHCVHDHERRLLLHGAVVVPDHVHLVLTPLLDEHGAPYPLSTLLSSIKGASAHSINRALGRRGHVWQDESFDHVLRSDESAARKVEYICQNPVRKGLVASEDEYPWLWREWVDGRERHAEPERK
jgi:REP element-mobilizing transposase RayT